MNFVVALSLVLLLTGCSSERCVTDAQASRLLQEGAALEQAGKPQAARLKYKVVDLYSCAYTPLVAEAGGRAVRIQIVVETAYGQTQEALEAYLGQHNRLPDSLSNVEGAIPRESLEAFRNFDYFRESDTEYAIALGLQGAATFDLSSRN